MREKAYRGPTYIRFSHPAANEETQSIAVTMRVIIMSPPIVV